MPILSSASYTRGMTVSEARGLRLFLAIVSIPSGIAGIIIELALFENWLSLWLGYGSMALIAIAITAQVVQLFRTPKKNWALGALMVGLGFAGLCWNILPFYYN